MSQINRYRAPVPGLSAFFSICYLVSSPKKFCKVSAVTIGVSVTRYRRYFGIHCAVLDIKHEKYLYKSKYRHRSIGTGIGYRKNLFFGIGIGIGTGTFFGTGTSLVMNYMFATMLFQSIQGIFIC